MDSVMASLFGEAAMSTVWLVCFLQRDAEEGRRVRDVFVCASAGGAR
jgi:hypothetical protein